MSESPPRPIIIKKKKVQAHGHHGGSWKVAYADFVTAMMAFFLVMWIMSMDAGVKDMVQGYFQNPVGFKKSFSGGKNILSAGNFLVNVDIRRTIIFNREEQEEVFRDAAGAIQEELSREGVLADLDAAVETVITDEGLRVELMETGGEGVFFDNASAALKPKLLSVLEIVASALSRSGGDLVIEGHTDALLFGGERYTNWELSVDRANAARRALISYGLPPDRVVEVRGHADEHLKIPSDPRDPRNRRITVLLPFEAVPIESLPSVERDQIERLDRASPTNPAGT